MDKIRQVLLEDGLKDFLRVVPFATFQTATAEGPIFMINISQLEYRSDAIIILQDVSDPVIVPPGLPESHTSCSVVFSVCDSLRFTWQGLCKADLYIY